MMALIRRMLRLPPPSKSGGRQRLDTLIDTRMQANRDARQALEHSARETTGRYQYALAEAARLMRER